MPSAPSFWHCQLSAVQPSSPGTQHRWILSPPMLSGPGLGCSLSLPPRSFLEELQGALLSISSRHDPLMCKQERMFVLSGKQRGSAESTLPSMDGAWAERALTLCPPLKPLRSPAQALLFPPRSARGITPHHHVFTCSTSSPPSSPCHVLGPPSSSTSPNPALSPNPPCGRDELGAEAIYLSQPSARIS